MEYTYSMQSWHFLPQRSEQDPAKAHTTQFSWSSCCFIYSHPLFWQQQVPGWFSGLCQSPLCLLCLCLDQALPSTKRWASFKSKEKNPQINSVWVLPMHYFHLTRNDLTINLVCKVETKLCAVCISSYLVLNLILTEICCILLKEKKKITSAQIAKVTTNCNSLVNEVGMYMHTHVHRHLLHSKDKELVLCFIWTIKFLQGYLKNHKL